MQHTKIYLSLAQSRAFDGPTGDPFGGPAFGKREMPVLAVLGAVMGGVAGAGLLGTTMFTVAGLGTVIGGAMIAGSVLTIAGTLSGNAKMAKIGSMLGLVGGLTAGVASMTGNIANTATGATMNMSDVFNNGMDNISNAWGKVTGTVNTGTVNAGSASLTAPIKNTAGLPTADAAITPVDGSPFANNEYGVVGDAQGAGGGLMTAPDASATVAGTYTPATPADYALGGPGTRLGSTSTQLSTSSQAIGDQPAATPWSMKDLLKDGGATMIGNAIGGIGTGVGNYLAAGDEAASLAAIRRGEVVRASNGPLLIDPNSPNRAEWEAYAMKQGVGTVAFGVAPLKPVVRPATYAPQVVAPLTTSVGLINR